jgi:hypothetical protein
MRKLKKSNYVGVGSDFSLCLRRSNTSTKPYARLMHALATLIHGECEPGPRWKQMPWGPNDPPTRAERREGLQVRFPNCAARRKMNRDIKFLRPVVLATPTAREGMSDPAAPRKITGAVRRGLEAGRVA